VNTETTLAQLIKKTKAGKKNKRTVLGLFDLNLIDNCEGKQEVATI